MRAILDYVEGRFGVGVAERVLTRLVAALALLAEHPGVGHRREDITKDEHVKFWSVGPTLIAYRVVPSGLQVLFVERAERDWEKLLAPDF